MHLSIAVTLGLPAVALPKLTSFNNGNVSAGSDGADHTQQSHMMLTKTEAASFGMFLRCFYFYGMFSDRTVDTLKTESFMFFVWYVFESLMDATYYI